MSQPQPPAQPYGAPAAPPAYGPPPGWGGSPATGYPAPYPGYPGQPAYPSSPGQDFAGPPPAPATPYPTPQAGQMPMVSCRLCGSVPAADATFRGHVGMIFLMRLKRFPGPFCRDCGLGTFRHMTSTTLVQGWYGYASFVITPITVLLNLGRRNKVASLPAPQPNPFGPSRPPMNPGQPLMARPMTWIGLAIPVVLLGVLIFAISHSNS